MEGEQDKKGGEDKEPALEGRVETEDAKKEGDDHAVHAKDVVKPKATNTRPTEKRRIDPSRKIERLTASERDILKESVARRARIEKLETIQRSIRNKKQYERRQALHDEDKAEAIRRRDEEDDYLDDMDAQERDKQNNMTKYMKYCIGGIGILAAGFFLTKK